MDPTAAGAVVGATFDHVHLGFYTCIHKIFEAFCSISSIFEAFFFTFKKIFKKLCSNCAKTVTKPCLLPPVFSSVHHDSDFALNLPQRCWHGARPNVMPHNRHMMVLMHCTDRDTTERTGCPNGFAEPGHPDSRTDFTDGKSQMVFGASAEPTFTSEISRRGVAFAPIGAMVDHFANLPDERQLKEDGATERERGTFWLPAKTDLASVVG
jgi:hypothetical protein